MSEENKGTLKRIRQPGSPTLYTDSVLVTVSSYGVKLSFGTQLADDSQPNTTIVEEQVSVGMSVGHAKSLHDILGNMLEQQEAK